VAKAIYNNGGKEATLDQLAAWMTHESVSSSAFRLKIASARLFGLIVGDDAVVLTDIGRGTQDPNTAVRTKASAFLAVPLYRKVFEAYRGGLLPDDKALEKVMESFGVASKQTNRARQTFQRSAEQAKVFNEKKDRLVLLAGVSLDSKPMNGETGRKMDTPPDRQRLIGRGAEINPAIIAFIEELPPDGEWTQTERDWWTRVFLRTLDKVIKLKNHEAPPRRN
jgi:hypothetical protein